MLLFSLSNFSHTKESVSELPVLFCWYTVLWWQQSFMALSYVLLSGRAIFLSVCCTFISVSQFPLKIMLGFWIRWHWTYRLTWSRFDSVTILRVFFFPHNIEFFPPVLSFSPNNEFVNDSGIIKYLHSPQSHYSFYLRHSLVIILLSCITVLVGFLVQCLCFHLE